MIKLTRLPWYFLYPKNTTLWPIFLILPQSVHLIFYTKQTNKVNKIMYFISWMALSIFFTIFWPFICYLDGGILDFRQSRQKMSFIYVDLDIVHHHGCADCIRLSVFCTRLGVSLLGGVSSPLMVDLKNAISQSSLVIIPTLKTKFISRHKCACRVYLLRWLLTDPRQKLVTVNLCEMHFCREWLLQNGSEGWYNCIIRSLYLAGYDHFWAPRSECYMQRSISDT